MTQHPPAAPTRQTWRDALSPEEYSKLKSWFEICVEPHYDNGGQTSQANGVALFRACKQLFETIERDRPAVGAITAGARLTEATPSPDPAEQTQTQWPDDWITAIYDAIRSDDSDLSVTVQVLEALARVGALTSAPVVDRQPQAQRANIACPRCKQRIEFALGPADAVSAEPHKLDSADVESFDAALMKSAPSVPEREWLATKLCAVFSMNRPNAGEGCRFPQCRCDPNNGHRYDMLRAADDILAAWPMGQKREWMPIESAPKDGTPIQVARWMEVFDGIWVRGWAHWETLPGVGGAWISHGYFEPPGELGLAHPTHWQPLPDPPSDRAESKQ